jgi:flagellar biosynthesis GTPase FlhF
MYRFPKCPNLREISMQELRRHFRDAVQGYRAATVHLQRQKSACGSSPALEERLRIISWDTDSGKTLYRCPICPDADETEIKSQVILHARSFVGVTEQHANLIRDAEEDAKEEEEDAKDEKDEKEEHAEDEEEEHAKDEKEEHAEDEEEEHAKDEKEEHAEDEEEHAEDEKDAKEEHAEDDEEEGVLLEEDASQACE